MWKAETNCCQFFVITGPQGVGWIFMTPNAVKWTVGLDTTAVVRGTARHRRWLVMLQVTLARKQSTHHHSKGAQWIDYRLQKQKSLTGLDDHVH